MHVANFAREKVGASGARPSALSRWWSVMPQNFQSAIRHLNWAGPQRLRRTVVSDTPIFEGRAGWVGGE
jgi:hypothetical protein